MMDWGNLMTSKMLDWKIHTNLTSFKTIQRNAVSWVLDSFNIGKQGSLDFQTDFFNFFFQDHNTTYEHKVCGYPDQSPKKIKNDFSCNPGCERIFSKHFNASQIPYNKRDNTFNFARFLHQSLEVSMYLSTLWLSINHCSEQTVQWDIK